MTDAAERAADAEQAEVEALNWQAEQQRTQEAMRAVFAAVLAEVDGRIAATTAGMDGKSVQVRVLLRGQINEAATIRALIVKHAAAGVELESNEADMQSAATDLAEQARTTALGYVMQAVSVQMEAPTPDADVLAALDVVVDLLSGKG